MECLLREAHHLVAFCPWIQLQVHQRRRNQVRQWSHSCGRIVDATTTIEGAHAFSHQLLLRIGSAEVIELLAPQIDLVAEVYLRRTDGLT